MKETRPSLKTSEFWLHAVLQIFFLLNTLQVYNYLPDKWSALAQAIIFAGYANGRGQAKSGTPYIPDDAPDTLAAESSITYPTE